MPVYEKEHYRNGLQSGMWMYISHTTQNKPQWKPKLLKILSPYFLNSSLKKKL